MIAVDTTVLLLFLSPTAAPPLDPDTGKPISDAKDRVDFLIEKAQKSRIKIVIPTPVLSEVLVRAGAARTDYLRIIQQSSCFKVMPFDIRAAVDVAEMTRAAINDGDKRGGASSVWAKVKFDRQIVAIAKNEQVTAIYSDDPDIRVIAGLFDIKVVSIIDMPIRQSSMQGVLPLPDVQISEVQSSAEDEEVDLPTADEAEAAADELEHELTEDNPNVIPEDVVAPAPLGAQDAESKTLTP